MLSVLYIKHINCVVLSNVSLGACLFVCWSVYVCDCVCEYVCCLCIFVCVGQSMGQIAL